MFNTVVDFKNKLLREQLQVFSGDIYLVALNEEHSVSLLGINSTFLHLL